MRDFFYYYYYYYYLFETKYFVVVVKFQIVFQYLIYTQKIKLIKLHIGNIMLGPQIYYSQRNFLLEIYLFGTNPFIVIVNLSIFVNARFRIKN